MWARSMELVSTTRDRLPSEFNFWTGRRASSALNSPPELRFDFDENGQLDAADIDILSARVLAGEFLESFDLNEDGLIDHEDKRFLVEDVAGVHFGDANLDRRVDFDDFLKLSSGFGEAGGWSDGDFDGNGIVEFPDFLTLSGNFGSDTSTVATAVPEPTGLGLAMLGVLGLIHTCRRR